LTRPLAAITGASSGIGATFARQLAPHYDLLLIARRRDRLDALARELGALHGGSVEVLVADLTDDAALTLVAKRLAASTELSLLVNNAGFGFRGRFWEADLGKLEAMHRLHVMATVRLTHAALGVLVARNHGGIVNVASVASFATRAGSASYSATKSWMAVFTEGLYLDLRQAGSAVKIQALCPGFTYSEFHDVMREDRARSAPRSWWLSAESVVADSLRGLDSGKLFVVNGWRYKLLVSILTKVPLWLKLRLEASRRQS
jgi:short-subunit dehydrogenase